MNKKKTEYTAGMWIKAKFVLKEPIEGETSMQAREESIKILGEKLKALKDEFEEVYILRTFLNEKED